jgi:hypothetical protein
LYQDRNNAKAAFLHHTQFLCLSWTDADRKRVLNSLYAFSLVQSSDQEFCVVIFEQNPTLLSDDISPQNIELNTNFAGQNEPVSKQPSTNRKN